MASKKTKKSKPKVQNVDSLSKAVRDITTNRKIELEEDPDLTKAICELADYAGEMFTKLLNESVQNDNAEECKKNKLLVLQLTYLKMCSELLDAEGKVELTSEIPTSGFTGVKPIDASRGNPLYV